MVLTSALSAYCQHILLRKYVSMVHLAHDGTLARATYLLGLSDCKKNTLLHLCQDCDHKNQFASFRVEITSLYIVRLGWRWPQFVHGRLTSSTSPQTLIADAQWQLPTRWRRRVGLQVHDIIWSHFIARNIIILKPSVVTFLEWQPPHVTTAGSSADPKRISLWPSENLISEVTKVTFLVLIVFFSRRALWRNKYLYHVYPKTLN